MTQMRNKEEQIPKSEGEKNTKSEEVAGRNKYYVLFFLLIPFYTFKLYLVYL